MIIRLHRALYIHDSEAPGSTLAMLNEVNMKWEHTRQQSTGWRQTNVRVIPCDLNIDFQFVKFVKDGLWVFFPVPKAGGWLFFKKSFLGNFQYIVVPTHRAHSPTLLTYASRLLHRLTYPPTYLLPYSLTFLWRVW